MPQMSGMRPNFTLHGPKCQGCLQISKIVHRVHRDLNFHILNVLMLLPLFIPATDAAAEALGQAYSLFWPYVSGSWSRRVWRRLGGF